MKFFLLIDGIIFFRIIFYFYNYIYSIYVFIYGLIKEHYENLKSGTKGKEKEIFKKVKKEIVEIVHDSWWEWRWRRAIDKIYSVW